MITWEKPLLRKIEETAAEHASSLGDSEREQARFYLYLFLSLPFITAHRQVVMIWVSLILCQYEKHSSSKTVENLFFFQLQTILEAVHPSSSGSQENTTSMCYDDDRPPSVMLEAVTLKQVLCLRLYTAALTAGKIYNKKKEKK